VTSNRVPLGIACMFACDAGVAGQAARDVSLSGCRRDYGLIGALIARAPSLS
jgi:hypothetical protein